MRISDWSSDVCSSDLYQQKIEWVRLKEKHPEYYEKAKAYEKPYEASGNTFTWSERESLAELEQPERMEAIKEEHAKRVRAKAASGADLTLAQVYERIAREDAVEDDSCLICTL